MDYETATKIVEECCGGCRTASDETVKACAVVDAEVERLRSEESETQCHLFNMTPRRTEEDMQESAYEQAEFLRPQIEELQAEIERLRQVRRAAERYHDVMWRAFGGPLELAAKFGPDFEPPREEEVKAAVLELLAALRAAGGE
jgi:hypothetical protein